MKRLIALLLTMVMLMFLLPANVQVKAAEQATEEPFYLVNCGVLDNEPLSNILNFPSFYTYPMTENTEKPKIYAFGVDDAENIAPKMKEDFNARPDGTRYIELGLVQTAFHKKVEHVVYFDAAVEMVKAWVTELLTYYKEIDGKIDGIILDLEYIESHAYYLQDYYKGTRSKTENPNIYADIVNDPRYKTRIRPMLEELGFEFYANPSGHKSEIWTIYPGDSKTYSSKSYEVWNHVMDVLERQAMNEAVLEPLLQYYPDAIVGDYQSGTYVSWEKHMDNYGSVRKYNMTGTGNVASYNSYVGRPESNFFDSVPYSTKQIPSYNKAIWTATPFSKTLYDVNLFKSIVKATPDGRVSATIGNYEYGINDSWEQLNPSAGSTYSGTPYYSEMIFHIGLLDPEPYIGFIVSSKLSNDGFYMYDSLHTTNDVLAELSRVAGYSDRKPILSDCRWNDGYMLTGMYSGGRNIWRITPDTTLVSVEDFKVKDQAPTFSVNGVTVTFPQGRIIEDGYISRAGSCGYWVETPTGVNPVVSSTANRYEYDPSLWVDFEEYTAGTAFTGAVGLPKKCWDVTGTAKIESGATGNALALSAASMVNCVTLPKNITAGDEYAKQQIWEVDLTLPSGFSGDVWVLKCADVDNGIKISGGKVYYDEKGKLKELSGVSLAAGTYTIRREVDFRTGNAFTSSYTIYDASGNLLGEVKNVAMAAFELPVAKITFSTGSVNKAVQLDNFKIYPTGTTTVLELFETKYGLELKDIVASRTEDTGYRMSWMNASGEYKVAYIYDGMTGNVIKKVNMIPGMDGVVSGVVKPDGKAVTIAVEVQTVSAPETPNYDEGYFDWEPYGSSVAPGTESGENDSGVEGEDVQETLPPEILETLPGWTGSTEPNKGTGTTGGNNATQKKGMDPGLIVLIICLSIFILGGGGFVLYWYVIKPKLTGKPKQKQEQEKEVQEEEVQEEEQEPWMSETQVIPNVESESADVDFSAETQIISIEETQEQIDAE